MSVISTPPAIAKFNKKLAEAGSPYWIGQSSGDSWGKYLVFRKGGACVGSAGQTIKEVAEKVSDLIGQLSFSGKLKAMMGQTSPTELAEGIGSTRQGVHKLLSGESKPTWDTVQKIASFFNVSTEVFRTNE